MSTDLDERPKEIYDDGEPTWQTNLEDDFAAPSATDDNLPEGHPSRKKKSGAPYDDSSDEEKKASSPAELKDKEEKAGADTPQSSLGKGYTGDDGGRFSGLTARISGNRKKVLVGGGAVAIVGAGLFSLFMLMVPLKIQHVVNNMQDRFFGNSESAVEGRVEYYFNRYVTDHVLKSLSGNGVCKSTKTIDRTCISPVTGDSPVSKLYRGWQEGRLETKMADQYGFEISKEPGAGGYTLKVDGKVSDIDVEGFRKNPANGLFQATGGRNDMRRSIKEALAGETRWKKVMYRYKVGRLMERKYGIKRCVFFCTAKDNFADWKDGKKDAFKAVVARRVLEPRSQTLGLAMGCIFSTDCDTDNSTDGNKEGDLEKKDKLQRNIDEYLAKRGAEYSADTVESVSKVIAGISESGGFGKFIIKEIVTKVTNETIAKGVGKAIPVVGWVDMVAQMTSKIKTAGPKFKKWAYAVNSAGMVAQYALYRSHADEMKGGKTDIALAGSVADSLNGMEQSPLYTDIMGNGTGKTAVSNLFSPSAYAESGSTSSKYLCDDGQPVPTGQKVCKEESLKFDNLLTDASDLFNQPPLEQLGIIADGWNASAGKVLAFAGNTLGTIIQSVPGMDQLNDLIAKGTEPLLDAASKIIPNPFSDNQSGGRSFNLASGGADVAGNHYAEFGLGGRKLTDQEVAAVRTARKNDAYNNFKEKPLYARLFDQEDSHSLLSQVAMSVPSGTSGYAQTGLASLTSNPLGTMLRSFGSIFGSKLVLAETAEPDPIGVPQTGYTEGDPAITSETPEDCTAYNKAWAENTKLDQDSGQEVHDTVNVCLLDQAAIGSGGAYFTSDVLTPEDLGQTTETEPASTSANSTLYFVGDSLTVGMKSGGLDKKLQDKGWSPTSNGLVSRKISGGVSPDGITQITNDKAIASGAGTIVIALGTNDNAGTFTTELKKMYDQAKSLNPGASIIWVNYAGSGTFAGQMQQKSAILASFASQNNIRVIDWASQGSKYITGNDVHPYKNYSDMADYVVAAIGQAPAVSTALAGPSGGPIDISKTSVIPGTSIRMATDTLPQFMRMVEAAKAQGIDLYPISSGWRDPQQQIALRKANCADWQNTPANSCRPPTAKPGTSNHEGGQAIDFGNMCYSRNGSTSCPGNKRWEWLKANAGTYGFLPLKTEAWHWSTTGR